MLRAPRAGRPTACPAHPPARIAKPAAQSARPAHACTLPRPSRSLQPHASHAAARRGPSSPLASASAPAAASALPELLPLDAEYEAKHTYSALANWLIPGRVMLGRYPYVEPSRCLRRETGEQQIKQLLEAGITTFVCLQAELPPQQDLKVGGIAGFLPYRAVATMLRSSMAPPPDTGITASIRNQHLDQFLPQRRKAADPATTPKSPLDFLYCPIVDLGIPTPEQVRELVAELQARLERGEVLYVHCWGGRGRAGTIGACLLATLYGVDAGEALERVQRAFDTRRDEGRPSPETEQQRQFVRDYIAAL